MQKKVKKDRLLLHIGLPKTATTSFQYNVCLPLHTEGRINFLGVAREDYTTTHYPLGKIANNILQSDNLSLSQIDELRIEAEKLLSKDNLNVFSEENISCNLWQAPTQNKVFCRISHLFNSCDIKCLISLRSPVEFIFSYYLEMYRWHLHKDKNMNTFDKFSEYFLSNPDFMKNTSLIYEDYLSVIG